MSKTIVIDYRGRASKQKGQRPVEHTYSPFIVNLYEDGVAELVLHPGINVLDREHFEIYKAKSKDISRRFGNEIVDITNDLPSVRDLTMGSVDHGTGGVIARTMHPEGLAWLEGQLGKISDKEQRNEVKEMIELRRPYARPVAFTPEPFRSHRGIDERDAAAGRSAATA
jgi:hypothetical protein